MRRPWLWMVALALMLLPPGAQAAPKGKVVLGMAGSLTTFDPHTFSSLPISMHHPNVFETLLARAPDGSLTHQLAENYKMVSPRVWEFRLRKGVKFSNGDALDAEAVKFSFERILDPKMKSRQYRYFKSIARVEAVDAHTVRIHTKKPDPMLPPFSGDLRLHRAAETLQGARQEAPLAQSRRQRPVRDEEMAQGAGGRLRGQPQRLEEAQGKKRR